MEIPVEKHPLKPFLPANAKLLMLGSFPPPRHRWCMDFYYPNPQNDMWRIFGHVFFGDKTHFLNGDNRTFNRERVVEFVLQTGVALYDTACAVRRLKANAADQFLEVAENTDIAKLLKKNPGVPRHRDDGGEGDRCAVRVERRREANDADGEAYAFTTVKA